MALIRQWLATALAFLLVAHYLPGFTVRDPVAALLAAPALGLVNAVIRPILVFFTLPLTLLTLGLFMLVINGLMIYLVAAFVPGLDLAGFGVALLAAFLVSLVGWGLDKVLRLVIR